MGFSDVLLAAAVAGLAAGGALHLLDAPMAAELVWAGATGLVLVPTVVASARALLRGEIGVDVIAVLAMGGALALGEVLAGVIVAVMLTGGAALERFAVARARRELTALLERAPRVAHRREGDEVVDVEVDEVVPGDRLVVKPGEVVPADGIVGSAGAVLDEAALTGESRPVRLEPGEPVRSGGTNAGGPLELRVTTPASESTYAGILRLVSAAERAKAPFVRLADRYAVGFLGLTIVLAAVAWGLEGDPVRALAVFVVATPCPLILAAPAALISGVSRAARHGIVFKGGGPLETLARARVLLLDKTGTVTAARPTVVAVEALGSLPADEVVALAASLEQASVHPFAPAIVGEARDRRLRVTFPTDVREEMGTGIGGMVDGRRVAVGQVGFVATEAEARTPEVGGIERRTAVEGSSSVYVAVDGHLVGALLLQDPIRTDAPRTLRALRRAGMVRIHMVTGDHPDVAELVGDALGVDRVFSERTPEEKVDVVQLVRTEGVTAMVGDGINDAPALALADVGIAMGARGATAASEAADVVLMRDQLDGLLLAVDIAQRTRRIALGSVVVGMGLSGIAMGFAAAGWIAPVAGAILQEGIDVLVIVNALRALGGGVRWRAPVKAPELAHHLADVHRELRPIVGELSALAGRLESLPPAEARLRLERSRAVLEGELLPHEREEQETAFPLLGRVLGGDDPTGPLVQTHHEIHRLARLFARLVEQLPPEGPRPEDLRDLRRTLYGLHAILSLHFAQEDELYALLD